MRTVVVATAIALITSATAEAQPDPTSFRRAADGVVAIAEASQAVPGASPALAVVIVRGRGEPIVWVEGALDPKGATPADAATPFYIASMTKAYVGLLAVELDRKGVLSLDARLSDVWPGLKIAGVPGAGAVTMRELLSHRVPFRVPTLNHRTAYTDDVPASAYRALLEGYAEPHDPAFSYSNLGYLIYGAAATLRTGRNWRDLLKEHVLTPLSLDRTSPVPSDFAAGSVTMGHQWLIHGFHPVVKSDALMHAAGGLVTSPDDMAAWLSAWLRREGGAIPASSFALASTPVSFGEDTNEGIRCTGYALGWHTCDVAGAAVHLHGGGYPGVRAVMGWSRELDAGIAVLSNSDSMTGGLSARLLRIFFTALQEPGSEMPDPGIFAQRYGEMVRTLAENRKREVAERRSSDEWSSWSWAPSQAELQQIAGAYRSRRLGELHVRHAGNRLSAHIGERAMRLEPAAKDVFAAVESPVEPPEPLRIERDGAGRPIAILFEDERFVATPR